MSNQTTEIVYTGLREGEKLDEELFGDYEGTVIRIHDKISRVEAPELSPADLPVVMAERGVIDEFCDRSCSPQPELGDQVDRREPVGGAVHLSVPTTLISDEVRP